MGTASAMPISDRNPSAQMLDLHGRLFLIDCGEGTQQSIRRLHLSFVKIEAIFISHIHGDHIFGIFGLLSTIGLYGRTKKLDIYAPPAFGPILKFFKSYFGENVAFPIDFHPLGMSEPQVIYESDVLEVKAFPLHHKIECYGFRFDEIVTERHMQENPAYVADSYAYCSDTMPFDDLPGYVRGVRALYHEATYQEEMADKARDRFHSTTAQAAKCAAEAGAGRLIVGHYSSRITDFEAYIAECRAVFPDTVAAQDGDVFEI